MRKQDNNQALTNPAAMTAERKKPMFYLSHERMVVVKVSHRRSHDPAQPHSGDQVKAPQSAKVFRLPIGAIQILDRAHDSRRINELAESMKVVGQRIPINVCQSNGSDGVTPGLFVLIAGHPQLEAVKVNGGSEIDCILLEGNVNDLRRRHIEERLFQAQLNKLDRSESIAQWVQLTNRLIGQHVGLDRPSGGLAQAARVLTVLGKTEQARRKVVEHAIRIAQISLEARTAAINAGFAGNQRALLDIAKQMTPEAQLMKVNELIASKRAKRNSLPRGRAGDQ
jgi:ParB-like chromosome segregation protein Spo0J